MTNTASTHFIGVSDEVYDVLRRTAAHRGTDINEVLKYLIDVPPVERTTTEDDEE
jgi:hypothetical protein